MATCRFFLLGAMGTMHKYIPVSHGILVKLVQEKQTTQGGILIPAANTYTKRANKTETQFELEKTTLDYWEVVAVGTEIIDKGYDIAIGDRVIPKAGATFSSFKPGLMKLLTNNEDDNHYGLLEDRHIAFMIRDGNI